MFQKKIKLVFVFLLITLFFSAICCVWYTENLKSFSSISTAPIAFTISEDEAAGSILSRLEKTKIIKSALAARIYLKLSNQETKLSPGIYNLDPSLSLTQILSQLFIGPKSIRITIPEGWRREQIAVRMSVTLNQDTSEFNAQEFIDKTATLEGQLYPDTYLISPEATTTDVINMLKKTFLQKTNFRFQESSPISNSDLDDKQILILASLVERETNNNTDRPIVAGIIKKRLLSSWPLQIDATIQYAIDSTKCARSYLTCDWWQPVTDTSFPSSYNTYQHPGLPPTPICNPGLESINAVRNSVITPYWFYITGNDGVTYYAQTLTEHNLNIDKYLRP